MIAYVDASVALRVLLAQPDRLGGWATWQRGYASEILGLEVRRTIDRLRLRGALDAEQVAHLLQLATTVEQGLAIVSLTRTVLHRAALPMPLPVRTLDALHLTTALIVRERSADPVVFLTHDTQQASAARALGFEVDGA
jgi:uncharacterized protein